MLQDELIFGAPVAGVPAEEAQSSGLIAEIHEDPRKRAKEIAETVAAYSANAMRRGLEYVREIRALDWAAAGRLGQTTRAALLSHEDFRRKGKPTAPRP